MKLSIEEYATYTDENAGYCKTCDAITVESGVEPDADGYACAKCGERTVYGVEQAVLMGLIEVAEEDAE